MRIEQKVALLALFAVFLSACGSAPKVVEAPPQAKCDFLPPEPQPSWVSGDSQIEGYYTGVGDSDASNNNDEATQVARQRALAALSSSIKTNVSQQLSIQIKETGSNKSKRTSTDLENQTQSITENLIKNSVRDDVWLNRKGCRLWMRMKVSKKGIQEIQDKNLSQQRLDKAKKLYTAAQNREMPHAKRLDKIEDALKQVEKVNFEVLPLEDRETYLTKYRKLHTQIISQTGSNEVVVITLAEELVPKSVHKELAYRISKGIDKTKHIYPAPCENRESCLDYALDLHAKRLITVSINTSTTSGGMGSMLGELTIDATLYDVVSRRQLSQLKNQKGQALSFDVKVMPWNQAIDRLFTGNEPIKQLQTIARDCGIQTC